MHRSGDAIELDAESVARSHGSARRRATRLIGLLAVIGVVLGAFALGTLRLELDSEQAVERARIEILAVGALVVVGCLILAALIHRAIRRPTAKVEGIRDFAKQETQGTALAHVEFDPPAALPTRATELVVERPDVARPSRVRVLLVEGNRVNQGVTQRMLHKLGADVTVAEDGVAAVERFEREAFDLVLMDCQMPRMNGYQATRAIRQREGFLRHTPIVALTAMAMAGDHEACIAAGMDDYMAKPVEMDELEQVLLRNLSPDAK